MTTTYDPHDAAYRDEAAARADLTRVFAICRDCRACTDLCGVFPALFDLIGHRPGNDPGLLTPEEQDTLVDGCYHCNRCATDCPYTPDRHDAAVDFPRLMLRAEAMRTAAGQRSILDELTAGAAARVDALRRLSGESRPVGGTSPVRRALAAASRFVPVRMVAPAAQERFSTWFARRTPRPGGVRRSKVGVHPTCLVEYQSTQVGRDVVRVLEHAGIECDLSGAGCCGAPWLHAGDVKRFARMVDDNVATLAREIRSGDLDAVVVLEPTCRSVMEREYRAHVATARRADADLVVAHLSDPAAHLLECWSDGADRVRDQVADADPPRVSYHVACHSRPGPDHAAEPPGLELLRAVGVEATVIEGCAGIGGRWRLDPDTGNEAQRSTGLLDASPAFGRDGSHAVDVPVDVAAGGAVGDCGLANRVVADRAGSEVLHPISWLRRHLRLGDGDGSADGAPRDDASGDE